MVQSAEHITPGGKPIPDFLAVIDSLFAGVIIRYVSIDSAGTTRCSAGCRIRWRQACPGPPRRRALDHGPAVAIVGQTARIAMGSYPREADLRALLRGVHSEGCGGGCSAAVARSRHVTDDTWLPTAP
jgi:hypothetical protein